MKVKVKVPMFNTRCRKVLQEVISNVGVMEATHNAASVKLSNNHWKAHHTIVECTQNYTVWEHFDISVSEMTTPGLAPGLRTPLTMDDFDPVYAVDIFPKRFTLWPTLSSTLSPTLSSYPPLIKAVPRSAYSDNATTVVVAAVLGGIAAKANVVRR